jgi:hypothetical protein
MFVEQPSSSIGSIPRAILSDQSRELSNWTAQQLAESLENHLYVNISGHRIHRVHRPSSSSQVELMETGAELEPRSELARTSSLRTSSLRTSSLSKSCGKKSREQEAGTQTVNNRKQGFRFSRLLSGCVGRS